MTILVSEIFGPVVQGEGPVLGRQTIFVRLFGCDSRCRLCDTMYAVDPSHPGAKTRHSMTPFQIVREVDALDKHGGLPVTISGGNPAIWDLRSLVRTLHSMRHPVWIETQGTIWRDWISDCDIVVVSPKGPGMGDQRFGVLTTERLEPFAKNVSKGRLSFKVVVFHRYDLEYAATIARAFPHVPLYLSVGNPVVGSSGKGVQEILIGRLRHVIEDVLSAGLADLQNAIITPQLHALVYGGKRGV